MKIRQKGVEIIIQVLRQVHCTTYVKLNTWLHSLSKQASWTRDSAQSHLWHIIWKPWNYDAGEYCRMHRTLLLCFIHGFKASPSYIFLSLNITDRRGIELIPFAGRRWYIWWVSGTSSCPRQPRSSEDYSKSRRISQIWDSGRFERMRGQIQRMVWSKLWKPPTPFPPTFPQKQKLILLNLKRG